MEQIGNSTTTITSTEESGQNIWTGVRNAESRSNRMAASIKMCMRLIDKRTGTNEIENLGIKISQNTLEKDQRDGTKPL